MLAHLSPVRVLIVEDEMVVARDLKVQLHEMGYLVVGHTPRGEDSIRLCGELHPPCGAHGHSARRGHGRCGRRPRRA